MGFRERVQAAVRAFKGGAAIVDPLEIYYGHDESTYSPAEYGDYLVTSNAVYSCVTLRADTLSGIPLLCYRKGGSSAPLRGSKSMVEVTGGPVVELMNKVNPFWTMNRLLSMTEQSLGLWGKAYWAVERGPSTKGQPQELWWMKSDRVTVYPDPLNYIKGFEYAPLGGGDPIWFDPWEVIWLRYPNSLDEYSGLSPLAAARLAADLASAGTKSNKRIFENGMQMGGYTSPKNGQQWTVEQAKELELMLDRRFKGVDKAHRWGVFRTEVEMKALGVTPKDAEFLGALNWSLEEVARAYKVPLDMIGGQRTYENVQAAERAFWYRTMEPESRFIASELVEQLLPMFGNVGVDLIRFDLSQVPILQEAESERWQREDGQIAAGALLINEWRARQGLEPVAWGNAWWAPTTVAPVKDSSPPAPSPGSEPPSEGGEEGPRSMRIQAKGGGRIIDYDSEEHRRLWQAFVRRVESHEKKVTKVTVELFRRQKEAILAKLKASSTAGAKSAPSTSLPPRTSGQGSAQGAAQSARDIEDAVKEPFKKGEWIKKFREAIRVVLADIILEAGTEALEELGLGLDFDILDPAVQRFLERRAQRFAREVNETTWNELKKSLDEGLQGGEGIPELSDRVEAVMAERIRSTPETIARTETIGAYNGGTLESWKQSGVVVSKTWLAALDDRTRDSHVEAHGQTVGIDEDFEVGGASGAAPGQMGSADEDINCRCTMTAVLDVEPQPEETESIAGKNGHKRMVKV